MLVMRISLLLTFLLSSNPISAHYQLCEGMFSRTSVLPTPTSAHLWLIKQADVLCVHVTHIFREENLESFIRGLENTVTSITLAPQEGYSERQVYVLASSVMEQWPSWSNKSFAKFFGHMHHEAWRQTGIDILEFPGGYMQSATRNNFFKLLLETTSLSVVSYADLVSWFWDFDDDELAHYLSLFQTVQMETDSLTVQFQRDVSSVGLLKNLWRLKVDLLGKITDKMDRMQAFQQLTSVVFDENFRNLSPKRAFLRQYISPNIWATYMSLFFRANGLSEPENRVLNAMDVDGGRRLMHAQYLFQFSSALKSFMDEPSSEKADIIVKLLTNNDGPLPSNIFEFNNLGLTRAAKVELAEAKGHYNREDGVFSFIKRSFMNNDNIPAKEIRRMTSFLQNALKSQREQLEIAYEFSKFFGVKVFDFEDMGLEMASEKLTMVRETISLTIYGNIPFIFVQGILDYVKSGDMERVNRVHAALKLYVMGKKQFESLPLVSSHEESNRWRTFSGFLPDIFFKDDREFNIEEIIDWFTIYGPSLSLRRRLAPLKKFPPVFVARLGDQASILRKFDYIVSEIDTLVRNNRPGLLALNLSGKFRHFLESVLTKVPALAFKYFVLKHETDETMAVIEAFVSVLTELATTLMDHRLTVNENIRSCIGVISGEYMQIVGFERGFDSDINFAEMIEYTRDGIQFIRSTFQ
jgi:hypothetical protein